MENSPCAATLILKAPQKPMHLHAPANECVFWVRQLPQLIEVTRLTALPAAKCATLTLLPKVDTSVQKPLHMQIEENLQTRKKQAVSTEKEHVCDILGASSYCICMHET